MKKIRLITTLCAFLLGALVAGCGDTTKTAPASKVAASMKGVSLTGGQIMTAFQFTLELPPGVSLNTPTASYKPIMLNNATDYAHVDYSVRYLPDLKTAVTIAVITPSGFGTNQSLDIDCVIAPQFFPQESDFKIYDDYFAKDQNGAPISINKPGISIPADAWR